jgi:hypothetical protein
MPKSIHTYLRWLAIAPIVYLAWHAALVFGMAALTLAEAFCPQEDTVSGLCVADWFGFAVDVIVTASAGLAGMLIVAASVVAPSHRATVATVLFLAGVAVAGYFYWHTGALHAFIAAVLGGGLSLAGVARLDKRRRTAATG